MHVTGVLDIEQRIARQGWVGKLQDSRVRIGPDRGELLKAIREVQVRVGIIHPPAEPAEPAAARARSGLRMEDDSCESEHVLFEARSVGPIWRARTVSVSLAGCVELVFVDHQTAFDANEMAGASKTRINA